MNAVEIEESVSALAETPFDAHEFPYEFLAAFGNKKTTIKRLRTGNTNKSDVAGGVLQRSNIHLAVCEPGEVNETLNALLQSPATASQKARYVLATDGQTIEAQNLVDGETLACEYAELADHFGFFLPLAGITTVKQIRENAFDIKATSRLNKLYVELLKENPDWEERREDLNHFFARIIFCYFAEDTNIFNGDNLFTATIEQMTAPDSSNTHEVIAELFRAMNTPPKERAGGNFRPWADTFPFVNGGLFTGSLDVPRFSRIARSYLLHIGNLDWTKINPDIFGSMIQAVAEDEERGELGMHYTSVPNILKVLNPLFLDELREALEAAGEGNDQGSKRKLLNLRNRMARVRVFDPACGSGNFLVIAYKEMREIEAEVNRRRGEAGRRSDIPLTNFRGIEIRHFATEIARLALIIAEYQCDVIYRGPRLALAEFLPLEAANWITCGNALRLDWLYLCPPAGTGVMVHGNDLFETPLNQAEMDFQNQGGETYICGNPPYKGSQTQTKEQKADLAGLFKPYKVSSKQIDYVGGWFLKAAEYGCKVNSFSAFVSTNSVCQGRIVSLLWPVVYKLGRRISFGRTSFKWANLATHNAGVIVVIIGLSSERDRQNRLETIDSNGVDTVRKVDNINAYLISGADVFVEARRTPLSDLPTMVFGNQPIDGGNLTIQSWERDAIRQGTPVGDCDRLVRPFLGSREFIRGITRWCMWIGDNDVAAVRQNAAVASKLDAVVAFRAESPRADTVELASSPERFAYSPHVEGVPVIIVPSVSSEQREFFPAGYLEKGTIVSNLAYALYGAPLWNVALIASSLHLAWIATVCGKLKTDYRYSNTLGWNTFPVPPLTEQNKADLTHCAEEILLARESYWPATIADMYDPDEMDRTYPELRAAHEANDETLERIYIGRRFKNDTERLEKLFAMYTEMIEREKASKTSKKTAGQRKKA